jgi:hypothetical protein
MGRGLGEVLNNLSSSISTLTVLVPRNISLITLEYRSKLQDIFYFQPDVIIIHLGHNDLVRHPVHNLNPSVSTAVASSPSPSQMKFTRTILTPPSSSQPYFLAYLQIHPCFLAPKLFHITKWPNAMAKEYALSPKLLDTIISLTTTCGEKSPSLSKNIHFFSEMVSI